MKLCANRHCLFGLVIPSAARAAAAPYAAVDLYPLNLPDGYGYGLNVFGGVGNPVAPGQIIGNSDPSSAVLWNAPNGASAFLPAAYVKPPGLLANNHGVSTDGLHQVGHAAFSLDDFHAVLWNGPGGPAVDLHPTALGFLNSGATGVRRKSAGWLGSTPVLHRTCSCMEWNASVRCQSSSGVMASVVRDCDGRNASSRLG